jgi:hypothetical protein
MRPTIPWLLLALAKTTSLTKKIKNTLSHLEAEERNHLESIYFQANDEKKELTVPDRFE